LRKQGKSSRYNRDMAKWTLKKRRRKGQRGECEVRREFAERRVPITSDREGKGNGKKTFCERASKRGGGDDPEDEKNCIAGLERIWKGIKKELNFPGLLGMSN